MPSNSPWVMAAALLAADTIDEFLSSHGQAGVEDLVEAALDIRAALQMPTCPTPWEWFQFDDPEVAKIKAAGTRVLAFVPRVFLRATATAPRKQMHPPKLVLVRWSTVPQATAAITPGRMALELQERHGGFWATDRRGVKPVQGNPTLWAHLPQVDCLP